MNRMYLHSFKSKKELVSLIKNRIFVFQIF